MTRTLHALRAALVAAIFLPALGRAEPVAIVVDRDNPKTDASVDELRSLFLGKRTDWSDGARAVPVDLEPGAPAREAFNAAVLKLPQSGVDQYWVDQKVRGAGNPPKTVSSPGSAVKIVAKVRGGVAYVPLSAVDGSVKVLSVGGVQPGQAGYPIQAQ